MDFFNVILYKPLFNSLIFLYEIIPGNDFGVAIIVLTITIKALLVPLSIKSLKSQKRLQEVQPKIKEIQDKYKNDKEKQAQELLAIYKNEKVNPFGGIFLTLIQLPILIALYSVFANGLKSEALANLYSFVATPGSINTLFLGLVNLSEPSIVFAVIAALCQFLQTKTLLPQTKMPEGKGADMVKAMNFQMTYFMPLMTFLILFKLPSALGLYWIVSGAFSTVQQYLILKTKENKK
jgi:YidC/Oxa1 family membrane protein insertase